MRDLYQSLRCSSDLHKLVHLFIQFSMNICWLFINLLLNGRKYVCQIQVGKNEKQTNKKNQQTVTSALEDLQVEQQVYIKQLRYNEKSAKKQQLKCTRNMCFNILLTTFHEVYDFLLKITYDIDALHILQMKK